MRIFLDTSVIVAAVLQKQESHARSFSVLERVQDGKDEGFVSGHGLAEIYAVLTKSPPPFRHSPEQALLSIEENVLKYFKVTALTGSDYAGLVREAALSGTQGGAIYDTVHIKCAAKAGAEKIFTLNVRHFESVAQRSFTGKIVAP